MQLLHYKNIHIKQERQTDSYKANNLINLRPALFWFLVNYGLHNQVKRPLKWIKHLYYQEVTG